MPGNGLPWAAAPSAAQPEPRQHWPCGQQKAQWRTVGVDLHGILTQDLHRKLTHPKRLLGVALCGLFGGAFLLLGLGGAVLETIAIVAGFNNVAVVRQAVQ